MSLPVLAAIFLLWRVFSTLPQGNAFSADNVRRFKIIARLAAADLALVLALAAFLIITGVLPAFILLSLIAAVYVGVVAIIVFQVLAGLVHNAVELRRDNELTI